MTCFFISLCKLINYLLFTKKIDIELKTQFKFKSKNNINGRLKHNVAE